MGQMTPLFTLFGINCYPYGLALSLGVLCATILLVIQFKNQYSKPEDGLRFALWAIPLALIFSRVVYYLIRMDALSYDYGATFLYKFTAGGYSMVGAILGIFLAVVIFGSISKRGTVATMDIVTPSLLLVTALASFAEYTTTEGIGEYVYNEALQFFPISLADQYGDYMLPIFLWEGIFALVVMCFTLRKGKKKGDTTLLAICLYSIPQIIFESLRRDSFLRFGFVRFNQLFFVLLLLIPLVVWLRNSSALRKTIAYSGYVVGVVGLILLEFAFDKSSINNGLLYAIMTLLLLCLLMGGLVLRRDWLEKPYTKRN